MVLEKTGRKMWILKLLIKYWKFRGELMSQRRDRRQIVWVDSTNAYGPTSLPSKTSICDQLTIDVIIGGEWYNAVLPIL